MSDIERMLPLYEGKMGAAYNHRSATFTGNGDTDIAPNSDLSPAAVVLPRNWVRESVVNDRLGRRDWGTQRALLGFRRVARNTDERTIIASFIPYGAASYGWILSAGPDAKDLTLLIAQYNSFVLDYVLRQFLSQPSIPQGTFEQIPCLPRAAFHAMDHVFGDTASWVTSRAVELGATGNELTGLATELGHEPPVWNPARREVLRAELDAAFFHLYGIVREDVDYIMDTFPIVRKHDEAEHGEYRTKRLILENYDAMAAAMRSGRAFESALGAAEGV